MSNSYCIENYHDKKCFVLKGRWSERYREILLEQDISALYLNVYRGWDGNLDFLENLEDVTCIYILRNTIEDVKFLYNCKLLEELQLSGNLKEKIDLSRFPKLEGFYANWSNKILNLFEAKKISNLSLGYYKSPSKDISPFNCFSNLRSLILTSLNITSIGNVDKLIKLKTLEIGLATKLQSLDCIENLESLERLEIDTCKMVDSFSILSRLKNLRHLDISNNGKISNIRFVEDLTKLEVFNFAETTDIEDGDLTPLLKLPNLVQVAFKERKHYNLRWKDLPPYTDYDEIFGKHRW